MYYAYFLCDLHVEPIVQIGNLRLKEQPFAEALYVPDFYGVKLDGIFGLSWRRPSHDTTPMQEMVNRRLISKPVFAFYFNK